MERSILIARPQGVPNFKIVPGYDFKKLEFLTPMLVEKVNMHHQILWQSVKQYCQDRNF